MIRRSWLLSNSRAHGRERPAVRPRRRGDHTVHLKPSFTAATLKGCERAPSARRRRWRPWARIAPTCRRSCPLPLHALSGRVAASRGDRATPGPASVDTEHAAPAADGLAGFCPRCNGLLVRARVEARQPFPSRPVPGLRRRMVRRRRMGGSRQQRVADALDDLWGPGVAPPCARAPGRTPGISRRSSVRSVRKRWNASGQPWPPLRNHPMALSRPSYLIEEMRSPAESVRSPTVRAPQTASMLVRDGGEGQMDRMLESWGCVARFWPAPR